MWREDAGYRWVVRGLCLVTLAGFLDTLVDWIIWPSNFLLAEVSNQELIIIAFFYAPGIVGIGYGLSAWIPKVMSLDGEVRLRRQKEVELLNLTEELREAKVAAESASRVKSEFLAMMSHEIRTPLNGVLGMTEVLLSSGLTPKQESMADVVLGSGQDLLLILNDILDLAKLEAGQAELHIEPVDLEELVHSVIARLQPLAEKKNLHLSVSLEAENAIDVSTDEGKVRQVLMNLVGNAIKFTNTGGVSVHISDSAVGTSSSLHVSIIDTGIGIAAEEVDKLFERFCAGRWLLLP